MSETAHETRGTFECPICGDGHPHRHTVHELHDQLGELLRLARRAALSGSDLMIDPAANLYQRRYAEALGRFRKLLAYVAVLISHEGQ